jgi:phage-related protein
MSREVDQRVVELQFNNTNFEKNTKKSMDSIDRMMEKLQFKGAEKGFEKLDAAAEKVDFATMNRSLDTLQQKFSALDIMAATVLVNIANKAMNAGERLAKSLSLDQITSGWNKYAEKTSNVQTIMNATGKSIDQVNGYLNKLMWYSDETSYSFNEMTSALSQMTAAGGRIDKMIPMIIGIANATADAGKTGFAFQSTIRNLTQSYSAGHLQLQDWKSLNLMGTATKALKQELIDTAEELGVIKKGEVTIASFESSLQKKWANTEVMEKTFAKYASMMEAAYELTQKNKGMTSSEALEQLKGQYGELAERAALAAQQATSFAQAIDSTKDAVSSKWMAVFETLFGNKEEATDTWTELANRLYDIFVPSIDALNDRMKAGLDTGWQQMLSNELGDQGDAYTYALEQVALATGALTEKQIEEAGSFGAALQENGVSADTLRQALDEARTSTEKLLALSDKELDAQGYDKDAIQKAHDKFVELNEAVQNGTLDLEGYAEAIGRVSGREHLMQGLWNIMDAIGKLVTPIKEAFNEIFPPADGDRIYTIAERFDLLTKKLIISDETAANIKKTFEGVFSVIRVGVNMLKTVVQTAANVLSAAVPLGDVLLGMTASIGGFVSSVDESLDPLEALGSMITGFVQTIAPVLYSFGKEADVVFSNFANGAKDAFNSFDPERMKDFITGGLSVGILASVKSFLDGIKSVGESAKGIIGGIKDTIDSLGEAIDAWKEAKKSETLITIAKSIGIIAASLAVVSMIKPERLSASMGAMTGVFLGLLGVMKALALISKEISSLKLMAVSTGMVAVSSAVLVLSGALKVISTIDKSNLLASVAALAGVMAGLTIVGAVLSKDEARFLKGAAGLIAFAGAAGILTTALKALSGLKLEEMAKGLGGISGIAAVLVLAAKLMNGVKFGIGNGAAFLMLAGSMNLLVSAFKGFGEMNWTEIGKALTTAGASIGIFVLALNLAKGTLGAAVALTTMAAAVNLLVPAIKELGSLSLTEIGMALLAVAGAFTSLGVAAAILAPLTPVIVALSLSISALALSIGALLALNSAAMFIGNLASSLTLLQNLNFQVFIEALKSAAWLVVEFITGIIKGLAEVASTLATSIAKIIEAVCSAIVLSAPAIGEALYAAGTTLIDVIIKLLDYIWLKCEPALNDLWDKFTGWATKKAENFSLLDLLGLKWENPFAPFLDELAHGDSFMSGLYQKMTGTGKYATEGFAKGETDKDAITQVKQASSNVANTAVETMKYDLDQHSPSKVMAEIGRFVTLGLAEGIGDQNALAKAKAAMLNVATGIRSVFTNFWGIHSPSDLAMSDAENILEGAVLGMCDPEARQKLYDESYNAASEVKGGVGKALDEAATLVQDKMQGIYAAFKMDPLGSGSNSLRNGVETARKQFETAIQDSTLIPGKKGIQTANTDTTWGVNDIAAAAKSRLAGYFGAFGDYYKKAVDDITTGTTDPTTKTKASKTGKSLAETLTEEYSKKLKANKYLQDALSKETTLWELQSEHSVTNEELLAKRTEVVTKQIELQADRVAIAQQQYDTLLARVGAGNDKTKDAYNTLLDEKANLEKLRQSRHSDIWGDVLSRYENDAKTAEDEYDLWVSMYEDTATVAERSNRQMMQINKKIDAQAKVVTAAEEEYTKLKEEFGEQSQQTQVAYRKYLEEQKEQQELINELEKAQLTQFANQITRYEKEAKIISNRQKMLEKLYDDGSLSERENAYEQAVEKYGEGSKEARRAAMQGTMSSLMGVGAAMRNMSTSLKKLTEYQKTYDFYVAQGKKDSEEALDALAELQDEQYNFVGFAESLASAFDMSENGKQAMMQLGYTISKNWKPIYNGFNQVWKKVNPAFAESLTNLIGLYSREGASETMAATMNAVVSAMRGDWASAVASGLTAVLDIVGTDFGRTLSEAIGNALRSAFSGNGLFAQLLSKLLGGMNLGGSGGKGFFSKALDFIKRLLGRKSTGAAGGGSGISKWLSAGKSALGLGKAAKTATDLVPVLHSVGTATANVASGVTTVAKAAGAAKVAATAAGAATSGTLAKVGMGVAKVAASLGPHGLLVGACVAGAALVGTAVVKNWDKVKAGIGKAWDWIKEKASNLWSGAKGLVGGAINIGKNVVGGLWNGIKGVAGGLWNGIKGIGRGIINGFKSIFGIHSPSTVFAGIGGYLMEGLANGITNTADGVNRSLEAVADGALDIAQSSAMSLLDVLNDESDPSIQPVVDLTNAENALDWMDSRLAGDRAVTLSATRSANLAGTVSRNANRQNGKADPNDPEALSASGNRDVVDAIQSMGERIDGVARAVANMKVVMNSRKLVGEIKSDMNTALGELAERGR